MKCRECKIRDMTSKLKSSYLYGMVTMGCVMLLFQDFHGKHGYINWLQENWISGYVTVPLAIFFLFFANILHIKSLNGASKVK
jgi:hypothetical protein